MTYELIYEYSTTAQGEHLLTVYLYSEDSFSLGGFTLRPVFEDANGVLGIDSIDGSAGFISSSSVSQGVISAFSGGAGVASSSRNGLTGEWVELAVYTLSTEPSGDILIQTEIYCGRP